MPSMNVKAIAAIAAVLGVAGCGGATPTTQAAVTRPAHLSPSVTPDLEAAAAAYLAAVAPANSAIATFQAQAAALPADASGQDAARVAHPLVAAFQGTDEKLLRVDWPTDRIRADVQGLVTADRTFESDLTNVSGQNVFSVAAWGDQISSDEGRLSAAVSIVRADLGLPPAKTG